MLLIKKSPEPGGKECSRRPGNSHDDALLRAGAATENTLHIIFKNYGIRHKFDQGILYYFYSNFHFTLYFFFHSSWFESHTSISLTLESGLMFKDFKRKDRNGVAKWYSDLATTKEITST